MASGSELVNKIDELLSEINKSRSEFAKEMNIQPNTMGNWKTNNSMPPAETVVQIAKKLEVSVDWLLSDDSINHCHDFERTLLMRRCIRKRIYERIAEKCNILDAENEIVHITQLSNLTGLSFRALYNWSKCRLDFSEYVLSDIAMTLGVSLAYLIDGTEETNFTYKTKSKEKSKQQLKDLNGNDDSEIEFSENNKYILKTAHRNLNDLFCLDNLTGERKSTAHLMLNQLNELEHLKSIEKQNNEYTDSE